VVSFLADSDDDEQYGAEASERTMKYHDDIMMSSWNFTQYRDTKDSHDLLSSVDVAVRFAWPLSV